MNFVGTLSAGELARRLAGPGLAWRSGPFVFRLRSQVRGLAEAFGLMYAGHPLAGNGEFCDCTLELRHGRGLRRWIHPQVRAYIDGIALFEPLPRDQAFALLEWTLNWWIAGNAHQYLLLHAAALERDGFAVVLPAPPGSGKSTLCAALAQRGWRLLSDEMAMIEPETGRLFGLARPMSLKNQSLDVIRGFEPGVVIGEPARDTAKGTVAHLRPRPEHVERMAEPARPRWVVFPRWQAGAEASLTPRLPADAFMELGRNAFNYPLQGQAGFDALARAVSESSCWDFGYGRLDDAVAAFERLAAEARQAPEAVHA